ncbi:hypothetical protein [Endozoicomonas lisbonensis]|uniref:Uncharacterized protein n=1 Tax=Endozoicomonas lisbonensis TaxID=3120522 RepID=A0ABV2SMI2_9GAMM
MKISQATPSKPVSETSSQLSSDQSADGSVKRVSGTRHIPEGIRFDRAGKSLRQRKVAKNPVKKLFLRVKARLLKLDKPSKTQSGPVIPERKSVMFAEKMNREQLTEALLFEWTGKKLSSFPKDQRKAVDNLNSFSMTAFKKLLEQGDTLSTTEIPNCVVCSKPGSQFPERAQELLSEVLTKYPDLKTKIERSDGLFKTPVMIAEEPEEALLNPEELQRQKAGVSYYPRIETGDVSLSSATTLFIPNEVKNHKQAVKSLAKALERAIDRAEQIVPEESRATARQLRS